MRYGFINNFSQALAADFAAGATTLTLDGGGAQMADASTDYRYKLTLVQVDAFGNETHREIVDVTAANGNDLTIVRQQEATTSLSPWPSGTKVYARVTAAALDTFAPLDGLVLKVAEIDMSSYSSTTYTAPAGQKIFIDSLDIVITTAGSNPRAITVPSFASSVRAVGFKNDSAQLAVGHSGGLSIIETSGWTVAATPTISGRGEGVAYKADDTQLAVGHSSGNYVTVLAVADWTPVAGTPALSGTGNAVAWHPSGTYLAIAHEGGNGLTVLDTSDWSVVPGTPVLAGAGNDLAWRSDGAQLAVAHDGGNGLTVITPADWSVVAGTPVIGGVSRAVRYKGDDTQLAIGHSTDNNLTILATADWSVVEGTPVVPASIFALDWSSDDTELAVGISDPPDLMRFTTAAWAEVPGNVDQPSDFTYDVAYSPSGSWLASGYNSGERLLVHKTSGVLYPGLYIDADNNDLVPGNPIYVWAQGARVKHDVDLLPGAADVTVTVDQAVSEGGTGAVIVRGYLLEM